jgi:hypothetical protein
MASHVQYGKGKGKAIHVQAVVALGVVRGWDSHNLHTFRSQMAVRLSPLHAGSFLPLENSWFSFLLEAESTLGPWCSWKD